MSGTGEDSASYRFFSYVREGYAPTSAQDTLTRGLDVPSTLDATVKVTANGSDGANDTEQVEKQLDVYGPAEVTGIDERQVVRVEPETNSTDFPPNYFPFVEFDRADLPWLFSPAAPATRGRLRPWMCLVTVRKRKGVSITTTPDAPRPVLTIEEGLDSALPNLAEADAWAHAQFVGDLATVESETAVESAFRSQSTKTVSRLLSPRRLEEHRSYFACVVPTFEPGRRVGLGLEPYPKTDEGTQPTIEMAWDHAELPGTIRLPVYYYWEFTTAEAGDFESLVRRLDATRLEDVGIRDIDVSDPGPEVLRVPEGQSATVSLEGALRSAGLSATEYDPDRRDILREILNQASALVDDTGWTDPEGADVLGPPLYGQWPPAAPDIPESGPPEWFRELNVDPRFRAPAGYGTKVVQDQQEHFMASAWKQVGEIRRANQLLAQGQLAASAQLQTYERLQNLSPAALLQTTTPQHPRTIRELDDGPVTVSHHIGESRLPDAALSAAFRRITRPNGPIARRVDGTLDSTALVEDLENDTLSAGGDPGPFGGTGVLDDVTVDGESVVGEFCDDVDRRIRKRDEARGGWDPKGEDAGDAEELIERLWQICLEVQEVTRQALDEAGFPEWQSFDSLEEACRRICSEEVGDPDALLNQLREGFESGDVQAARALMAVDEFREEAQDAVGELETHRRTVETDVPDEFYDEIARGCDEFDTVFGILAFRVAVEGLRHHCRHAQRRLLSMEWVVEDQQKELIFEELVGLCEVICGPFEGEDPDSLVSQFEVAYEDEDIEKMIDLLGAIDRLVAMGEQLIAELVEGLQPEDEESPAGRLISACDRFRSFLDVLVSRLDEYPSDPAAHLEPAICRPTAEPPEGPALDFEATAEDVLGAIDPEVTIPIRLGERIGGAIDLGKRDRPLDQIMAAPEFTDPMYEPLRDLSQKYLMPGVENIPADCVGVLETNPTFVESYMVGLSHEMARELRWREYPTDQRGTYFRRFWERRGSVPEPTPEQLNDIDYVHLWDHDEGLGKHADGASDDEEPDVVLLVRGELLDRYPNTVLYAAKAVSESDETTGGEYTDRKPDLPDPTADDPVDRPGTVKHPIFRGALDPDITFFGFDLRTEDAVGTTDDPDDLGWFFVLEEPPAEPRFGLDIDDGDAGQLPAGIDSDLPAEEPDGDSKEKGWNALSWGHLVSPSGNRGPSSLTDIDYVPVRNSPPRAGNWRETTDTEPPEEYARWGKNSAHMAAVTWQRPVRIAIHADDMLPEQP